MPTLPKLKKRRLISCMEPKQNLSNPNLKTNKKLTYRTPDRFRRKIFRRQPALSNVRSFGGHR